MNELFDVHSSLDGFVLTYEGQVIFRGTFTGCARAMIEYRKAYLEGFLALDRVFATEKRAA